MSSSSSSASSPSIEFPSFQTLEWRLNNNNTTTTKDESEYWTSIDENSIGVSEVGAGAGSSTINIAQAVAAEMGDAVNTAAVQPSASSGPPSKRQKP